MKVRHRFKNVDVCNMKLYLYCTSFDKMNVIAVAHMSWIFIQSGEMLTSNVMKSFSFTVFSLPREYVILRFCKNHNNSQLSIVHV